MAITRPVTRTLISTVGWGIPITDEVNRLSPLVDNSFREVGYAEATAGTSFTTLADVPGLSVTFTAVATHKYKVTWYAPLFQAAGVGIVDMKIFRMPANVQIAGGSLSLTTSQFGTMAVFKRVTGLTGSTTLKCSIGVSGGTVNLNTAGVQPTSLLVEDLGV